MTATQNANGIAPLSDAACDLLAMLSAGVDEAVNVKPVKNAQYFLKYGLECIAMIRMEADACDADIRDAVVAQVELCGASMLPKNWTASRFVAAVRQACRIEVDPA